MMDYDQATERAIGTSTPTSIEPGSRNLLQAIWDRKWIVLICLAIGLLAAEIKFLVTTPTYTASAEILVQPSGVAYIPQGGMGQSNNLNAQAELITKPILLASIPKPALRELKTFAHQPNPERILRENLTTSVGMKDDLIKISYDSPFPEDAAKVVNLVIEAYRTFTTAQHSEKARREGEVLSNQIVQYELDLKSRGEAIARFRKENKMVNWDVDRGQSLNVRVDDLAESYRKAQEETSVAKQAFEDAVLTFLPDPDQRRQVSESGRVEGIAPPVGVDDVQIRQELRDAQDRLQELRLRYLNNHPAVQSAQYKVSQLSGMYIMMLHHQWTLAKNHEDHIAQDYQSQKKLAEDINAKRSDYEALESGLQSARASLDKANTELKAMHVSSEAPTINIEVWGDAEVPTSPSKPKHLLLLFEGAAIGLLIGLGLALADQKLRSVDEITAVIGLPVLGVIPRMSRRQTLMSRGRKVHLDPISDVAEAFRNVRSAILFSATDARAKTILITSATRGDGKSTVASNIAISMAEAGRRILLIDGDLREPTQHRIFSTTADKGVSSVVSGRATLDRAITATAIKNLDILPCGPIPLNPAETINNQTFADMLEVLAQRYDRIIIDSPPVMPVTDSRILAAMCDLTILVLRAEKSTRRAGRDARDGLFGFGARLLGVVVNDGRRRQARYSYYGGYGARRALPHGGGTSSSAPHAAASDERADGTADMVLARK